MYFQDEGHNIQRVIQLPKLGKLVVWRSFRKIVSSKYNIQSKKWKIHQG